MSKNGFVSQVKTAKLKPSQPIKAANHPRIIAKVVSDTPGRLRLRVATEHRKLEKMQQFVNNLKSHPNIKELRMNVPNGSITIQHEGDDSQKNVMAALYDLGMIFSEISGIHTDAAIGVSNAVIDFNKRVKQASEGKFDVRVLFPFGLGCLAIRQLFIKGLQFDIVPWYVLAWYSFDSFIKLHGTNKLEPTSDS